MLEESCQTAYPDSDFIFLWACSPASYDQNTVRHYLLQHTKTCTCMKLFTEAKCVLTITTKNFWNSCVKKYHLHFPGPFKRKHTRALAFHYNLTFTFKKSFTKIRKKDIQRHFSSIAKWSDIFVILPPFPLHQWVMKTWWDKQATHQHQVTREYSQKQTKTGFGGHRKVNAGNCISSKWKHLHHERKRLKSLRKFLNKITRTKLVKGINFSIFLKNRSQSVPWFHRYYIQTSRTQSFIK